jgi:PAS domain S-box-containing protein
MDRSVRVLHVDDEPEFVELTATYLERESDHVEVETATDPGEALDRLDGVDCVVSDYDMPGTDGIGFLAAVREERPDLPFILFTGKGSEEVASEALRRGATDYLRKGGTERYELLANRIENAVEGYRATQRAANLGRIRSLINDVNQALVRADGRAEVETEVTDIVTRSAPYVAAWIGDVDREAGEVTPGTSAGIEPDSLEEITLDADGGPLATAVEEERVAVSTLDSGDGTVPDEALREENGARAVAAVPLAHGETLFGVLAVYASASGAFDEAERSLLVELGDDIAHALHSVRTQQELAETMATLEALVSALPDVAVLKDREGNELETFVTPDAADLLHEGSTEGRPVEDVFTPEQIERVQDAIGRALDTREITTVEYQLEVPAGERWFEARIAPVADAVREDEAVVWVARDITDRKEREQQLERESERFGALFENTNDAVAWVRYEGETPYIEAANPAFRELFEPPDGDVVGRSLDAVVAGPDRQEEAEDISRRVRAGEYMSGELVRETAEGARTFRWQAVPINDPETGDVENAFAVYADISELRERERELGRQHERFDGLASVISHDLKTPLATATGRLELAVETGDLDHAERALGALARLDDLREDLAGLLRGEQLAEQRAPVDLADVAAAAWESVGAGPEASLDPRDPPTVEGDRDALARCFENLLSNALEHGGPDVSVAVGATEGGFYVADDGPGIPPEKDVFAPGVTSKADGSGMGLASVRQIVHAHGWDIRAAESAAGGARFEVTGVDVVEGESTDVGGSESG